MEGDKESDLMAVKTLDISIHALRVEGDRASYDAIIPKVKISIHALRVEGDSI